MSAFRFILAAALLFLPGPISANILQPLSLRTQYEYADVVVVARTGRITTCSTGSSWVPCIELVEPLYLKGRPPRRGAMHHLVTYTRIAEARVDCCTEGTTYLMFLQGRGSTLFPLNGRFSILQVDGTGDLPLR
jgi:hypothetical protein